MEDSGWPIRSDNEWLGGWRVVTSAFFGMAIGSLAFFTQGVFLKPLSDGFGWTRTEVSVAGMIFSGVSAIGVPVVGQLISRHGPRRFVLAGWVVTMSAFATLGLIGDSLGIFYLLWFLMGTGVAMAGPVSLSTGVTSWFNRRRGAAVSMSINGVNVVGSVAPLLATALVANFGWRAAYVVLAGGTFCLCFPLLFAWFRERPALKPGCDPKQVESERPGDLQQGFTAREAIRMRVFWTFGSGVFLIGGALVAMVVHFIPALSDRHYPAAIAASALSANSLVAIVCGAGGGFMLDRYPVTRIGPLLCFFPALGSLFLATGYGGLKGAVAAAAMMGVTSGLVVPMISVFVSRYLGMRQYGAIFGLLMGLFSVSQGAGAVLVSAIHDATGSYVSAFFALAGAFLLGACLIAMVGKPGPGPAPGI